MKNLNLIKTLLKQNIKFCPKSNKPVKALSKWVVPIFGILSVVWIIMRVVPKPSRVSYPCMKVAIPFASSLILYLSGIFISIVAIRKAKLKWAQSKYIYAVVFFALSAVAISFSISQTEQSVFANNTEILTFEDPLGPNSPIGDAKGIFPGRVVWVHNPNATTKNCTPDKYGDGYFLDKNCDQVVVDDMLIKSLLQLTGAETENDAWIKIFEYYNINHQKGEVGYQAGEKIFIKINAVHAWNTNNDLSIANDDNYGNVDTSPQIILALLRQLINKAGVAQESIYIGDPYTQIFKHCYEKWADEFPNIHYMSRSNNDVRDKLSSTNDKKIVYSDKGTELDEESDGYFDCIINADYILNVPAIKGHRWGGVTFFAKNHFGSNTADGASHLHKGLHRIDYDAPLRDGYNRYRVFVDLMAYEHLGGKTLMYLGDMLWSTSYEHDPPVKFMSQPFNNDWSSSILLSLDPVAISSVALDILQAEFTEEDLNANPPRYTYVQFSGIDDYLHQAASSDWWPEGIIYDPEDDGTPIESLGVHEHWNNAADKQYSRNLGTGEGVELLFSTEIETTDVTQKDANSFVITPTIVDNFISLQMPQEFIGKGTLRIYSILGNIEKEYSGAFDHQIDVSWLEPGAHIVQYCCGELSFSRSIIKR
ncbi:MAG: DUF362 domain-containing protein [Salinivirgaceae bacterium]|jgi:hypothetical protein|nr:DUF362 domain-containing protein [Salinivirgaceae bacterium]